MSAPAAEIPAALQLAGRVALVTGASRGIGRAVAETLAARGAAVAVGYAARGDAAEAVCRGIVERGGRAVAVQVDVGSAEQVQEAVDVCVSELGGLQILVNNAGVSIDALLLRAKDEDFRKILEINLEGAFRMTKAAARHLLRARDAGRVINVSSVVGEQGNVGQAMYAASKAGLIGLTKSLAREFAPRGVTVNAVAPGFIETDMTEAAISGDARSFLLEQIPLRRIGVPQDVAEAVAYLAAPAAAYVTGHVLRVNGGLLI